MATAKKLPSGSWRCRVYDYTDENGKKHYKSFTSDNPKPAGKREAEAAAAAYAVSKKTAAPRSLTFQAALEAYIEKVCFVKHIITVFYVLVNTFLE